MLKHTQKTVRVLVSGAAGQVGYSLVPLICSGAMLGPRTKIILHLFDIPRCQQALEGLAMELEDCAYPCVESVVASSDVKESFTDVEIACLVGGFPRLKGMNRSDLLEKNGPIFKAQGEALEKYASKNVKVVVVANPANTNCFALRKFAPSLPNEAFSCLTRLDHNRAVGQVAKHLQTNPMHIKNLVVWGNHSSTMYPDTSRVVITSNDIKHLDQEELKKNDFMATIRGRGGAVIKMRGKSSAMSAAKAVCDHVHDWVLGTSLDEIVSMGVMSNGEYGVEKGLMFSYPVTCDGKGNYEIVNGIELTAEQQALIKASNDELVKERATMLSLFEKQ